GDLLARLGEEGAAVPVGGAIEGAVAPARDVLALDADEADGVAAEVCVPHDGGLGGGVALPALEAAAVLIDHGAHQRTHRERLLAPGVLGIAEQVTDGLEA